MWHIIKKIIYLKGWDSTVVSSIERSERSSIYTYNEKRGPSSLINEISQI